MNLEIIPANDPNCLSKPVELGTIFSLDSEYSSLRVVGGKSLPEDAAGFRNFRCQNSTIGWRIGWVADGHLGPTCVKKISTLIDSIQEELEFDPPEEEVPNRIEQILEKFHQGNVSGGTTLNLALQKTEENIVKKVIIGYIGDSTAWVFNKNGLLIYKTDPHVGTLFPCWETCDHMACLETKRVKSLGGTINTDQQSKLDYDVIEKYYRNFLKLRIEQNVSLEEASKILNLSLEDLLPRKDLVSAFKISHSFAKILHQDWQPYILPTYLNNKLAMTKSLGDKTAGPGHTWKPTWSPWLPPANILLATDGVTDHLNLPPWMSFDPIKHPVGDENSILEPMKQFSLGQISLVETTNTIVKYARQMWSKYSYLGSYKSGFNSDMDDMAIVIMGCN